MYTHAMCYACGYMLHVHVYVDPTCDGCWRDIRHGSPLRASQPLHPLGGPWWRSTQHTHGERKRGWRTLPADFHPHVRMCQCACTRITACANQRDLAPVFAFVVGSALSMVMDAGVGGLLLTFTPPYH